jgi:hypothetical protein
MLLSVRSMLTGEEGIIKKVKAVERPEFLDDFSSESTFCGNLRKPRFEDFSQNYRNLRRQAKHLLQPSRLSSRNRSDWK